MARQLVQISLATIVAPPPLGATNQRTGVFYSGPTGPQLAIDAAARQSGDVILVNPGEYSAFLNLRAENAKALIVRCAVPGQRWVMDKKNTDPRVVINSLGNSVAGANAQIFDAHIKNAKLIPSTSTPSTGGAVGLFGLGTLFRMSNCVLEECALGFLCGTSCRYQEIFVESNLFINCGSGAEPNTHGIYNAGDGNGVFTSRGNQFVWTYTKANEPHPLWAGVAHGIKSHSYRNFIQANLFDNRLGSISSAIDCSACGSYDISGNVLIQSATSDSANMITWSDGTNKFHGPPEEPWELKVNQNTFIVYGPAKQVIRYIGDGGVLTARGGSNTPPSITFPANATATPFALNFFRLVLTGGTGAGQVRMGYKQYDGVTKVLPTDPSQPWAVIPDATTQFAASRAPFAGLSRYEFVDNVLIGAFSDLNQVGKYPAASNSVFPNDSALIDAPGNQFGLDTPVLGSANRAPYRFVTPAGFAERTDSFRGAVPSTMVSADV